MAPSEDVKYTYASNIEAALRVLSVTRRGRRIVELLRKHEARFMYTAMVPRGAGLTLGNLIFLNPEMRDPAVTAQVDKAVLVAHEATHFWQWLRQRRSRFGSQANERVGNAVERMIKCELLHDRGASSLNDDLTELVSRGRQAACRWLKNYWRGYGTFPERQPTYRQWRQWLPQVLFIATGERIELQPPFQCSSLLRLFRRKITRLWQG